MIKYQRLKIDFGIFISFDVLNCLIRENMLLYDTYMIYDFI